MGELIETHHPDLIVVACNTASTLVLSHLRTRFGAPFVGTVPAIKPACAISRSKRVAVLGTETTAGREYTRALIRDFADGSDVALVGSPRLAVLAAPGGAVCDFNQAKTALASTKQPGRGADDGKRLTDGATNRPVQIHTAERKFRPTRLAYEVGGAVLRGVWRAPHAASAKCRRPRTLRPRDRIRDPRGHRDQPPARRQRPPPAGLDADVALAVSWLRRNRRVSGGRVAALVSKSGRPRESGIQRLAPSFPLARE